MFGFRVPFFFRTSLEDAWEALAVSPSGGSCVRTASVDTFCVRTSRYSRLRRTAVLQFLPSSAKGSLWFYIREEPNAGEKPE